MASPSRPEPPELADYLRVLRRRWRIVFAFACLGLLAAVAYVVLAPKSYTATASVYVDANAATANQLLGARATGAVNMDNEAQVVQSDAVAEPAAKALHTKQLPSQLVQQISTKVPANTTVLQINCSGGSPSWAATCAQAFATSYLATREANAKNKAMFKITQLQNRTRPLLEKGIKLREQARAARSNRSKHLLIVEQIKSNDSQLSTLRGEIAALGGAVNYSPGYILTPAIAPTAPSSPKAPLDLPSGLLAGLLLGLLAAFVIDRRDDRVHEARDLERSLALPVLMSLPEKSLKGQTQLIQARSQAGRAFTELAEAVAAGLGDGNHVLLVAASSRGEGCTFVAANLAVALARTRSDVLFACAYYEDAITPGLIGLSHGRGLAELLTGVASVSEVARRAGGVSRLQIIPPAVHPGALVNDLDYDDRQRKVTEMRRAARYVIIAAQAEGDDADAFSLAEFADAALVTTTIGRTLKAETANCVKRLDRMRTPVLGAAVLPSARWDRMPARRPTAVPLPRTDRDSRSKRPSAQELRQPLPANVGTPPSPAPEQSLRDDAAPSPIPTSGDMHG